MRAFDADEYDLTLLHLEAGFHRELLRCMTPWILRAQDVRRCIYINATDNTKTAKEQWFWMQKYELMLVQEMGNEGRFLPSERETQHVQPNAADDRISVTLDDPFDQPPADHD